MDLNKGIKMRILLFILVLIMSSTANATLTVNNVPRTKTGGGSPSLQDSNITADGTNVGVGSTVPVAKLDVNGVVKATSFQSSGTNAGTVQFFEASANGSNYINWTSPASLSTDLNWSWPSSTGTAGQVLMRDTSSGTNWSDLTAVGNITGSGTANKVTKWTSSTAIGDSVLTEISSNIGIGSASPRTTLDVNGGAYFAGSGGNVGIGSTNPGAALDVAGAIRVGGNFAGGTTGNVGIGTFGASAATCDSVCNSTNTRRCFHGVTSTGIPTGCAVSITGTCICLPQS